MKGYIVLIILFFATGYAAIIYSKRIHRINDEKDKLISALNGVKEKVPQGGNLSYTSINADPNFYFWARYTLVPLYISHDKHLYDTLLVICSTKDADSLIQFTANNRKMLWQNKDSQYYYLLTCSR